MIRLDDPGEATAMRASPDAVLATKTGTVLLDEWQEVPEVLGAVKRLSTPVRAEPDSY